MRSLQVTGPARFARVAEDPEGVDVTTHRGALLLRASVVTALAVGALAVAATPAYAAANVRITVSGSSALQVGGSPQTVNVRLTNNGDTPPAADVRATIDIPLSSHQVGIGGIPGNCERDRNRVTCRVPLLDLGPNQSANLPIQVTPPAQSTLQPGEEKSESGSITLNGGGASDTAEFRLTLRAAAAQPPPTQAAGVTEVSGSVVDSTTGTAIKDATVKVTDSTGKSFPPAGTNSQGKFRVLPPAGDKIAPGSLAIEASKDKFDLGTMTANGAAGQATTNVIVRLKPNASASASVPGQTAGGVDPSELSLSAGAAAPTTKASTSGLTGLSWALLLVGGLLVLLGIGAIVLLLRRNKEDDGTDEDDPDGGPGGPGSPPGSRGVYRGADPTMVAGSPAAARPNSDATQIVRGAASDYDGYPASGGRGGYSSAGQAGYGAGYAEETQVGGYGGSYGPAASRGPYGAAGGSSGDSARQYDAGGQSGSGSGGYDQRSSGHDDRAWSGGDQDGYGRAAGSADQRGGYHDDHGAARHPTPPAAGRGDRPRLDWLDD